MILLALTLSLTLQQNVDRTTLTTGVGAIVAPGAIPGPMIASGPKSFVVLAGSADGARAPLFVAAKVGDGKVLAGGHESFFGQSQLRNANNAQFLANAIYWLSGKRTGAKVGLLDTGGMGDAVTKAEAAPISVTRGSLAESLGSIDIICMSQSALDGDAKAQDAVMKFVKSGHGLLIAGPAWGWQSLNGGRSLKTDHAGNRMLLPYGIGFSDGYLDGEFSPAGADDPLLQTESALDALKKGGLAPKEISRATGTVQRALTLLPSDNADAAMIRAMAAKEGGDNGPTAEKPITMAMPFSRLKIALDGQAMAGLAADKVRAHPSAASFPGAVPASARRVTKSVEVDTKVPNWHGTGLYAAPGEVVTVTLPSGATEAGLSVRMDAHTDELWHLDKWERFPSVSRAWPLRQQETKVASPFGGTIYIDVPNNCRLGQIAVTIDHAVPAPWFVRGKTSLAEWQAMVKEPGAQWVDLEGKLVILTVPRYAADTVKDPEALMAFWDEMMDHCYELYSAPRRARPERYCVDRQISAGYMHSGYPIMTWEDVAKTFCDVDKLRGKGATWGFFHEMGHNFQEGEWTFEGTGEVTNNLFSLYGSEMLNGITQETYGVAHKAMEPAAARDRLKKYLASGAPYKTWTSDPFLALTMYAQLRQAFGWESFMRVFADYRKSPRSERPRSEEAKRDQWMVRFSKQIGKNLGPFFQAWGVPTSQGARDSIKNLPTWMPSDWPTP